MNFSRCNKISIKESHSNRQAEVALWVGRHAPAHKKEQKVATETPQREESLAREVQHKAKAWEMQELDEPSVMQERFRQMHSLENEQF